MKTKPFNIDEAKAGAKVVNRNGEAIRIVCYDSKYSFLGCHQPIIDDLARTYCDDGVFNPLGAKSGQKEDLLLVSEPRLRPWKPEEVPVGALIKYKDVVAVLSFKNEIGFGFVSFTPDVTGNADARCWSYGDVYEGTISHSTDGGKTWHPCGAEE